jgi:hypothetical protein
MRSALLLLCAVLVCSCNDALPCNQCPAIEGAYLVSWSNGVPSDGCPSFTGPRPANLNVTRVGSIARTTIAGEELSGTVYDTYDYVLNGGTTTVYSFKGHVVPTGSSSDGGIRLQGSMLTTAAQGDAGCQVDEAYVADKL